ncbi:MAG: zinc-finger domain-containing protein [Hyphomicrobiales bacterium]|nr:zinc-finger domain-containing protein [Rickettsiales bacterium]MCP5361257.1 zinc-finger domain-containing protein [Hyphomicrobiales bacterium]
MREAPEIIEVAQSEIACEGNGPALGHPRVYLKIDPAKGFVECPYCDRKFVLNTSEGAVSGGH